jgi:L-asparaginase II
VEPLTVLATRGDVVEARHVVHAVAVRDGAVVLEAGDPGLVCFLRSSAKPLQALAAVRARPDLSEEEVAIACASHLARPEQLAAVRTLLAKAPADEAELECGGDPSPIEHNCSGKHAAMLALCRARGWPSAGYRLAGHPGQEAMLAIVAEAAEVAPDGIPRAVDGCGVETHALPLERMALAFSRLPGLDGADRIVAAMQRYPDHIRGPRAADSILMRHAPGWKAKGGAEGLLCAVGPDGTGLAVKAADGETRAIRPALRELVRLLGGPDVSQLAPVPVLNSHGEEVGEVVADS